MSKPFAKLDAPFRPRARLLQLLGDQLIASPRLAVFELVKNAYDADATDVSVTMKGLDDPNTAVITVRDNGTGMDGDVIKNAWLVPADNHREVQRLAGNKTKLGRLPVGEKGLGRFAVHKLGEVVKLTTRSRGDTEYYVEIDWRDLASSKFLDEAKVHVIGRAEPEVFKGNKSGTLIEVSSLRGTEWTKREVRHLYRQVMAFCSPFDGPEDFKVEMEVVGQASWLKDIPDTKTVVKNALWEFEFEFADGKIDWDFKFKGVRQLQLEGRTKSRTGETLLVQPLEGGKTTALATEELADGIGPVSGTFRIFDRDKEVLSLFPNRSLIKELLDENGGVRVYRDGVRVHDYGEREDDWLGLDLRRVNTPTRKLSRNIVIGEIRLDLAASTKLVEKTNREGFVDNSAYQNLRRLVLGALTILEAERKKDKDNIRARTGGTGDQEVKGITLHLTQLRRKADLLEVRDDLEPLIARVESDYKQMRDTLLQAGMSGVGLALVFHEIERGIKTAHDRLEKGGSTSLAIQQLSDIRRILADFSNLLRSEEAKEQPLADVVKQAIAINRIRFQRHGVGLVGPFTKDSLPKQKALYSRKLVLAALTNLLDNAVVWLDVRYPNGKAGEKRRKVWLSIEDDLGEGPAIVIADTGPGLQDELEDLVRPFFTRRPGGMGLGLYYANMVMEITGGRLISLEAGDVDMPEEFEGGAKLALVFDRGK